MTHFEKLMATLTAIYVFLTGIYAMIAYSTLRTIKRQEEGQAKFSTEQLATAQRTADAAKTSADAALLNAQAVINSERAWVVPEINRTERWVDSFEMDEVSGKAKPVKRRVVYFTFSIRNYGKTPAEVFAIRGHPRLTDKGINGGLADPPDYGADVRFVHVVMLAPRSRWVHPDMLLDIWNLDEETKKSIEAFKLHYIFKGVVLYRDIFKPEVVHESRFCYTYFHMRENYLPSGPAGHTGYT